MDTYKKLTIDSYDKTVEDYNTKGKDAHPLDSANKFSSYLDKNSFILDLGCGPGRDANIFAQKGFKVVGVDLSKKMIEFAKEHTKNVDFKVMDICNLTFEENLFDGIWANAIFLHVPKKNIRSILKEIYRILKKDGVLFILALKEGEGEVIEKDDRFDNVKKFWSYFKKDEFEQILKEVGFKIIESYTRKSTRKYSPKIKIDIFCKK